MGGSKKRVVFMGSPLPEDMVELRTLSFNSGDNIAQNVMIKGLHRYYGSDLTVISELSEKRPEDLDLGDGITAAVIESKGSNRVLYYVSLMKNYTKKLNAILRQQDDASRTVVITRGLYVFIAVPVLIARLRHRVKWVPFIITTVEVPEYGFPFNIVSKMSRWTSKKVDAAIAYVARTAEDYMPGKPFLEIAYSIDERKIDLYAGQDAGRPTKFTIAYTGALSNTYNFDYVIDAIKATGRKYRWVFAGTGVYAERIQALAADDAYDVEYLGEVSNAQAIALQKSSHLLLCPRGGTSSSVMQYYSTYAASGKLTEYLCSGTPILASDVPSTSESIRSFLTLEASQTADGLIGDVRDIEQNYEDKLELAGRGREYAFTHFNAEYQNSRVCEFIEGL